MQLITSLPNVSTPCVTTNPCTCPVYGPGGAYLPVEVTPGVWECRLALESPGPVVTQPVPALDSWALTALVIALAFIALRKLRP